MRSPRTLGATESRSRTSSFLGRWAAGATAVALALVGVLVAPHAAMAATGAIEDPTIVVVSDGSSTTSPQVDDDISNGIVGTNDSVCFVWTFASSGLDDGVLSQTLPAGWQWTEGSLVTLSSNSALYSSSYVITGDVATGQTVTATISVPDGSSIIELGPLCAVPTGSSDTATYTPRLSVTDEVSTTEVVATDVTVIGMPKADVVKTLSRGQTYADHDFGAGAVPAAYLEYVVSIRRPIGAPSFGSLDATFPNSFVIEDSFSTSPVVATTDFELVAPSSGTATLSGTDILVSDAVNVGSDPWGVTVRVWFPISELPLPTDTPAFVNATNSASVTVDGIVDEDLGNNTATGSVQGYPIGGAGTIGTDKQILVANDPANPVFAVDPWGSSTTHVTGGLVSPGSVLFARFYMHNRDPFTGAVLPFTDPVLYDFWDPTQQQIIGGDDELFVGDASGPKLAASDFVATYTTGDGSTVDPETLTWFPETDPAFDPATVRGVRLQYVGNGGVWTGAYFLAGVPFRTLAATGVTIPDTAKFVVDESTNPTPWTRFVTTTTNFISVSKAVDRAAITSGGVLTYTLSPNVDPAPGSPLASDVTGLVVTDTLPPSIVAVDTSGVSPEWSVNQTPGNPGPDGVPGTNDDISGITLGFTYVANGGVVSTSSTLPQIEFAATTSVVRPTSGTIVNTAVISADDNVQAIEARTAAVSTAVAQANVLAKTKVADFPQIEVRDPQVSWTSSWFNFQSTAQGLSYFVDVLPYNGDGRGTSFSGTAELASAVLLGADAATYALEYTTDAPGTIAVSPASATTWIAAPAGGDFTGVTGVTAVRVVIPSFASGELGVGGLQVVMDVHGQADDDVYANTITGRINVDPTDPDAGIAFPAGPPVRIVVVASDISGLVWRDLNGDGLSTGESGIPGVQLALVNLDGTPVFALDGVTPVTTTTGPDGTYLFDDYHSGSYRVIATPPAGARNTYDNDGTLDSDSGGLSLPVDSAIEHVDFGYQYFGSLVVQKTISGPGAGEFGAGPFVFDVDCTFNGAVVLDESVTLTPLEGDDQVLSEPFTDLPEGAVCIVTETDNGGADTLPAPVTVTVTVDDTLAPVIASVTNLFSQAVLQVTKVLEGAGADREDVRDLEFEVLVTCQVELPDATLGTVYSGTVTLRGGETVAVVAADGSDVLLPRGAHCFGEETETGGADTATVDFDSYENAAVVGTSDAEQQLTITATNTFGLVDITVEKIVVGVGSAGPFSFEVECVRDREVYELAPQDAAFELSHGESRTIEVLAGVECTASEIDIPSDVQMSVVDTDDSTEGGGTDGTVIADADGQTITVTNQYVIVSPQGPTTPSGLAFTGSAAPLVWVVVAGAGVIALGLLLALITARRRRNASPESR